MQNKVSLKIYVYICWLKQIQLLQIYYNKKAQTNLVALQLRFRFVQLLGQIIDSLSEEFHFLLQQLDLLFLLERNAEILANEFDRVVGLLGHSHQLDEDLGEHVDDSVALDVAPELIAFTINWLYMLGGGGWGWSGVRNK